MPTVVITKVEGESAYGDVVAPVITFEDNNFDAKGTDISLGGSNYGIRDFKAGSSQQENGSIITYHDFDRLADVDDIYTLVAQITDLAGNTSEQTIIFSVNRYGSVYELIGGSEEQISPYYLNKAPLLVVRETNVNELSSQKVMVAWNGKVTTLPEGDYEVKSETGSGGWKVYTYTVPSDHFENEGQYSLTFMSEDKADNTSSNRIQNLKRSEFPIEFVVDKTAPTILFTGVEDNGRYTEAVRPMLLNVEDNEALGKVTVTVSSSNGDKANSTYTAQDFAYGNVLEHQLTSSTGWQSTTITAVDMAGNITVTESFRILLTENLFAQFINNAWAVSGTAILFLGAGIFFILLFVKKRKKEKEEEEQENEGTA